MLGRVKANLGKKLYIFTIIAGILILFSNIFVWVKFSFFCEVIKKINDSKIDTTVFTQINKVKMLFLTTTGMSLVALFAAFLVIKHNNRYLIKKQDLVIQSEKKKAINQVTSLLNHDLRNCLTGLKLGNYYIRKKNETNKDDHMDKLIIEMELATKRIQKFCDNLCRFCSLDEVEFFLKETDINKLVKETISLVWTENGKIKIVEKLDKSIPSVFVDGEQMREMLKNIFSNAISSMSEGGELIVTSNLCGKKFIELQIIDSGKGIAEEHIKNIFIPFFTTEKKAIGLGLPIVREIIRKHKGSINVASQINKGTSVTIKLPIKDVQL